VDGGISKSYSLKSALPSSLIGRPPLDFLPKCLVLHGEISTLLSTYDNPSLHVPQLLQEFDKSSSLLHRWHVSFRVLSQPQALSIHKLERGLSAPRSESPGAGQSVSCRCSSHQNGPIRRPMENDERGNMITRAEARSRGCVTMCRSFQS